MKIVFVIFAYIVACVHSSVKNDPLPECSKNLDKWGIDIFKLNTEQKRILACVTYSVLNKRDLVTKFKLDPKKLNTFLTKLEDAYVAKNPYHNNIHAADVVQSAHVLSLSPSLLNAFNGLEILALIIAAAGHDAEHPGFNNQYLMNSGHGMAKKFKNQSVLEQHHLFLTKNLITESKILSELKKDQLELFNKMLNDLILATDMAKHNDMVKELEEFVKASKRKPGGPLKLNGYNEKMLILKAVLHLADISNPTKPLDIYKQWAKRIVEEFWKQGDEERKLKLPIAAGFDRHNSNLDKMQVGFIDFMVRPLWKTWENLVKPDAEEMIKNLNTNYDWYKSRVPKK